MKKLSELKNPPKEYRGAPFWAWNSSLDKTRLEFQLKILKEMGFGGVHIHSRVGLEVPYLSEGFLEMVEFSLQKGRELDLLTYLYDEDRWPSGYGSGIVTQEKKFRAIHLLFTATPYEESKIEDEITYKANFAVGVRTNAGKLLGVYDIQLDEQGYLKAYSKINAEDTAKGKKWYAYVEENPPHTWYNGGAYVDVLNKEAIDCFLNTSYETYRKHFANDFGTWIPSIFTDEPHMIFKTNLSTPFSNEDQFLPWTWGIEEECFQRYHVLLGENLPLLFWECQSENRSIRYAFHRTLADLFEKAYAKNIWEWCKKNKIAFTGHYLYEETLFEQNRSDGDLMRMYRNMDWPGMDLLFDEVDLTTGKQIQSVVHQYGKKWAISEEYGVTNWSFELRDYLFQSDWQTALGINKRVPHLSLMSMKGEAKRDFPASISYQAPWALQMKIVEEHCSRLAMLLESGKPIVRVAVLHPIESYWLFFGPEEQTKNIRKKLDEDFQNITTWLLTNGIDFDFLNEELLTEIYCEDDNTFGYMKYDVIILPALYTIRFSTLNILKKFTEQGKELLCWGRKPLYMDGIKNEDFMRGLGEVIPYTKEAILKKVKKYREVQYLNEHGETEEALIYQYKRDENEGILFIASVKKPKERDNPTKKKIIFKVKGEFSVCEYNTLRNELQRVDSRIEEEYTVFEMSLYEGNSLCFHLTKKKEAKSKEKSEEKAWDVAVAEKIILPKEIAYKLEESNIALLDMAEYSIDQTEFQSREEILKIDEKLRKKLGYRARSFNMAQPYTYVNKKEGHQLVLRYSLESKCNLSDIYLALEEADAYEIILNGEKVNMSPAGWYIDQEITKIYLGNMKKGHNDLQVKINYKENTNLEAMYLLGEFSVHVTDDYYQLDKKSKYVKFDNLVGQGLDFYGGNIRYIFPADCPNGFLKIHIPKYRGFCIGIEIDGKKQEQCISQAPFDFIFNDLSKGTHEIALILYGNRYNTLSHLHDANKENDGKSFPMLWRTEGENWTYSYQLRELGIIGEPEVFV